MQPSRKPFIFCADPAQFKDEAGYVGVLDRGAEGAEPLIRSLYEIFDFPGYYGSANWDALDDYFGDFVWIKQRRVILVHQDLPRLSDGEMGIYLSILWDSIHDWKPHEYHRFDVVFPASVRETVESVLSSKNVDISYAPFFLDFPATDHDRRESGNLLYAGSRHEIHSPALSEEENAIECSRPAKKPFIFCPDPAQFDQAGYVGVLDRGIEGKEPLIRSLYETLGFPGYYGSANWSMLDHFLGDFKWIQHQQVVLIHQDLPRLSDGEMMNYLGILWDSINHWDWTDTQYPRLHMYDHRLDVVFPASVRKTVESVLSSKNAGLLFRPFFLDGNETGG